MESKKLTDKTANIKEIRLEPNRGSKLYLVGSNDLKIQFQNLFKFTNKDWEKILAVLGNSFTQISQLNTNIEFDGELLIQANSSFMILNFRNIPIDFQILGDFEKCNVLWDPYLYEEEKHQIIDSNMLKKEFIVPEGYIDVLAKWYSVKFSYPDCNLIFLRPQLGISIQTHKLRTEHWEIISGNPIVITEDKVEYNVIPTSTFTIPRHAIHGIINPSTNKWVCLKETYTGTFDEEDIERLFNPNHYISPDVSN
ncbi:MAG: hypothetical protein ACTSXK_13470 [Promethearchaeota archaeon]